MQCTYVRGAPSIPDLYPIHQEKKPLSYISYIKIRIIQIRCNFETAYRTFISVCNGVEKWYFPKFLTPGAWHPQKGQICLKLQLKSVGLLKYVRSFCWTPDIKWFCRFNEMSIGIIQYESAISNKIMGNQALRPARYNFTLNRAILYPQFPNTYSLN